LSSSHNPFNVADFNIIRKAKNTQVKVKSVPRENIVIFDADGVEVLVKKDNDGYMIVRCDCDHCGAKGIARGLDCRRKLAVNWALIKYNGRISEVMVDKEYMTNVGKKDDTGT